MIRSNHIRLPYVPFGTALERFAHHLSAHANLVLIRAFLVSAFGFASQSFLVGPSGAHRLDPPDGSCYGERSLEPHESGHFASDVPGVAVRRHSSKQRSDEFESNPELWLERIVSCGFREFADQHSVLTRRHQFQLDEPGRGREGHRMNGLAGAFRQVLRDCKDHATVVNVEGQIERAIEQLLLPVLVGLGFHVVLSGGSLQRNLGVIGECRPALYQAIALQGEDTLLSEHHRLIEQRPVLEVKHHAALDLSATTKLEEITGRNEDAVERS